MNTQQLVYRLKNLNKEMDQMVQKWIKDNSIQTPQIELDIMKQKTMEIYEILIQLHGIDVHSNAKPVEVVKQETKEEKPVMHMEDFEKKELEILTEKNVSIDEPEETQELPLAKEEKQEKIASIHEVASSKNEMLLHEKISTGVKSEGLKDKVIERKVESLKAGINLNQKIAFVNELFAENTVEYAKAIDRLNSSENLHEAMRYFSELKHQYNWVNDNARVKELEDLISKRYQ